MSQKPYLYLCDGYGCDKQCAKTMTPEEWAEYDCHHTSNEKHARNKCRRTRKFNTESFGYPGKVCFVEKDPANEPIEYVGDKVVPLENAKNTAIERKPVEEVEDGRENS